MGACFHIEGVKCPNCSMPSVDEWIAKRKADELLAPIRLRRLQDEVRELREDIERLKEINKLMGPTDK